MRRDGRRDDRRDARRKCNSFEKDRVAYRARQRRRAVCCTNDEIVCLKNRRALSRGTSCGKSRRCAIRFS